MSNECAVVDINAVKSCMVVVRNQPVLLAQDVAAIYNVETRAIAQAVKNNPAKFPEGYVFDLTKDEIGSLKSKILTLDNTYVLGPDGKCGYGNAPQKTRQRFRRVAVRNANAQRGRQAPRKCFPKDVNAFTKLTEDCSLGKLLAPLHDLNVHFRGFEEHI